MRFGFHSALATLVLASLPAFVPAASVPSAIYTDPLHIPTHGVAINGLAYLPSGPGAHPVLLICHGLPGNEKNLDLAQAVRRAGWVAATTAARDDGLLGAVLISAWDPSRPMTHRNAVVFMASDMESLAGVTANGLKGKHLLVLSSDDGLAPGTDALIKAIRAGGGDRDVTAEHVATDHSWADRRIALASSIIGWLSQLPTTSP
jgi:hypothetical protein